MEVTGFELAQEASIAACSSS